MESSHRADITALNKAIDEINDHLEIFKEIIQMINSIIQKEISTLNHIMSFLFSATEKDVVIGLLKRHDTGKKQLESFYKERESFLKLMETAEADLAKLIAERDKILDEDGTSSDLNEENVESLK